jgi:hypothetical protein
MQLLNHDKDHEPITAVLDGYTKWFYLISYTTGPKTPNTKAIRSHMNLPRIGFLIFKLQDPMEFWDYVQTPTDLSPVK